MTQLTQHLALLRACGPQSQTPGSFDLLLMAYDKAAMSCRLGNQMAAAKAIAALCGLLDFSTNPTLAETLLALYRQCLEHLANKRFNAAEAILSDLGKTWRQARALPRVAAA